MTDRIRMGVIGCGYWGPNHIRVFNSLASQGVTVLAAADKEEGRRTAVAAMYPHLKLHEEAEDLIENDALDALVIATPAKTHYPLAKAALEAGKHVLIEKPFVTDLGEAEDLIALARRSGRTLMVGHTFEYTAAVNHIREQVAAGSLGDILHVRSARLNLGLFQQDINVLWDLAPHDISILLYTLQKMPTEVCAVGSAHVTEGVEDVVNLSLKFGDGLLAGVSVSWLDPRKVREMTFVGTDRMLVYDDIQPNEKIRVYDKGVEVPDHYSDFGEFQYSYRYGDIVIPKLDEQEPLKVECRHFVDCIRSGEEPRSGARAGLDVVRVLTAAERSLSKGQTWERV